MMTNQEPAAAIDGAAERQRCLPIYFRSEQQHILAMEARGLREGVDFVIHGPGPTPEGLPERNDRPRPAETSIIGPVDGMNERHPEGSYFRMVITHKDDTKRHCSLLSRGEAEALRDDLNALLGVSPAAGRVSAELLCASKFEHAAAVPLGDSVVPAWLETLSFQQQSVVLLALRGPDGVRKHHPAKAITIAYRGAVLRAAERGRFLWWGEAADTFMGLDIIADEGKWRDALKTFFAHVDELPHHYVAHLAHAAQIIAAHHPHEAMRSRWGQFYARWVDDLHLAPETPEAMDARLDDWGTAPARLGRARIAVENRAPSGGKLEGSPDA